MFAGIGFLLLGLNDLAVDVIYFTRRLWRSRTVYKRRRPAYASYYVFKKGPGFIAVFVAAVTLRSVEMHDEYHVKLHEFTDQIERIFVAIVLILFGGTIADGILSALSWKLVAFAAIAIFLIRPLSACSSLFNTHLSKREKIVISFFGIKGVGSLFYLSFALNEAMFDNIRELWAVASLIILFSILVHGLTATKAINKIERDRVRLPS